MFPNNKRRSVIIMTDLKTNEIDDIFRSENRLLRYFEDNHKFSKGYVNHILAALRANKIAYLDVIDKKITRRYIN